MVLTKYKPSAIKEFLSSEATGGVLLIVAAALAMIFANFSPDTLAAYNHLLHFSTGMTLVDGLGPMTIHLWVNDGLMAIFFLLVGLEIKREFLDGRLATSDQRRLPIIAAAAGMIVPALIYLGISKGNPTFQNGWAIPAATDIAFAVGVISLLGKRAPLSLKLFLTTVAIVDDMGAVAIIALAYTPSIKGVALLAALVILGVMYLLNRSGVKALSIYLLCFVALWFAILHSGVHATIAGVLAAIMIPLRPTPGTPDAADSPLHILEHKLHPWSAYLIVPLFGFANAGVSFKDISLESLLAPLPLAVAAGLFFGKQIGIFGSVCVAVKFGFARQLRGATWLQIYGLSALCGIGFTMSLFIGSLAFPSQAYLIEEAKMGILMGSVVSALAGFAILRFAPLHPEHVIINAAEESEIVRDGDVKAM